MLYNSNVFRRLKLSQNSDNLEVSAKVFGFLRVFCVGVSARKAVPEKVNTTEVGPT